PGSRACRRTKSRTWRRPRAGFRGKSMPSSSSPGGSEPISYAELRAHRDAYELTPDQIRTAEELYWGRNRQLAAEAQLYSVLQLSNLAANFKAVAECHEDKVFCRTRVAAVSESSPKMKPPKAPSSVCSATSTSESTTSQPSTSPSSAWTLSAVTSSLP